MSCNTWTNSTSRPGSLLRHSRAHIADDVVDAAAAICLQFDGDVAGVRLGNRGQAEFEPGAPRRALHFRRVLQDRLDVTEHAVGLLRVSSPAGIT